MNPILMIYPTYETAQPQLLTLQRDFTDDQFLSFITALVAAIEEAQAGKYERRSATIQLLINDGVAWQSRLSVDL
jgi:hypothetical protein